MPTARQSEQIAHRTFVWFCLSLAIPSYFGIVSLHYAFSGAHIIQDDARQHIVWLQHFYDNQLFNNDLIASYFHSVAPNGYLFFYQAIALWGIEPVILAKILPIILAVITSGYFFGIFLQILPIPYGAFLATLIFNQSIWAKDDLISATPRAFLYPLFAAFLYYLLKRSLFPCLISIALQGLFYPQLALVEAAILTIRLLEYHNGKISISKNRSDRIFWLAGLLTVFLVLLPFALRTSEFAPVVTAAQMQAMPEFGARGRSHYFGGNWFSFFLDGDSGIGLPLYPYIIWVGLGLPVLLKSRLPFVNLIHQEIRVLLQIILGSLGLFILAHLLLLRLHLPNRYTAHSLRVTLAIAAGIVLTVLIESGRVWLRQKRQEKSPLSNQQGLGLGLASFVFIVSLMVPMLPFVLIYTQNWIVGTSPQLYQFFAAQPKDILVASIDNEVNNIPAFSGRSILVGREFALPYHTGYYNQIRQRSIEVVKAQYSPDLSDLKQLIQKYGIDFFLVNRNAFSVGYIMENRWLMNSSFEPAVSDAIDQLNAGKTPALAALKRQCLVFSDEKFKVLDANCLAAL